jgi:outer membrane protein assembly factor BamB/enterochelin esterase-like enzyme
MTHLWKTSIASRTSCYNTLCLSLLLGLTTLFPAAAEAQEESARSSRYAEENNQIRRDKFDLIVPKIMRDRGIDMWIHVMREPIADPFGAEDLGSTSGVFIFTDRGGDRIERAIIGRRWQTSVYEVKRSDYVDPIPALGAYDIIGDPVRVIEPLSSPMTEYDYRFNGLREFVEARNPKRIALNYREHLAPWATFAKTDDGISHVDYRLLTKELGETYADRLVSSEYLIMDFNVSPVPSEVALLKKMRADDLERVDRIIAGIKPGVTKTRDVGVIVIRRMCNERLGWDDAVVQGGDILAAPSQGRFAYVLRDGETEPPADIKKLWAEHLMIDKILTETVRAGLTPREIMKSYKQKLADVGIVVIDPQLTIPQTNLFESLCFLKPTLGVYQFDYGWEACWDNGSNVYPEGFDPENTQVVFDMHGVGKGSREKKFDQSDGLGPRMGTYGPDWTRDVPLAPNHHFVLEYFFYMPSPTDEGEYLIFFNHEQVIATENGVERLSPQQQELLLISAGASVAQQESSGDWPHLRGPELDGTAMSGGVFDGETVGFRERWRVAVGPGYSGVAIAEGCVVTSVSDGATDAIQAFSAADGSPLWKYTIGPTHRGHDGSEDGMIGSPVIGRGKVFVVGPRGKLFALDFDDGELKWSVDLITELGAEPPLYGFAMTPLLEGDMLIVQVGAVEGRALCGLNPDSGELVWSVGDGFQEPERCQSPIVMSLGGHRQVVAMNGPEILGVAPTDGTILWRHSLWEDANASSGFVCPMGDDRFCAIIDGRLSAFRVSRKDSDWSVEMLFRSRELGKTWAAPVYFAGNIYGFKSNFLSCVDAASGKRLWRSRPPGGKGLILVDDRLVVFGSQGVVAVAAASPKGYDEELRGQFLEHSSFTWPSFANGHIFVRNSSELVCIQVVQADTAVAVADAPQPVGQGAFGRFVQSVTQAKDKTALVDAFFAGQKSFPIVEGNTVHVVYRGDVEDVAIAGAMLDDARPRALQRVEGTNFYYRSYPIEPGARWEYGLQVDFGEPTPDPLNPRTTAFGVIYDLVGNPRYEGPLSEVVMPGYDSATHLREPEGARGRIETYEFESVALGNKRSIKVYLPVGYGDGEAEYPLLIVHRGPEWLEKGKMTHSLDNLIGTRVQPVVVAFVPPGPIWWSEGAGTGTDKYLAMLVEEFVPDLERRYRLSSRPQDRALIGANWFGLTAAYGVILFPEVFGKAGVQSAGLGEISVHDFFERLHSRPANDAVFYVDWNRYEMRVPDQSWDQRADGLRLSSELRKQGYKVAGGEALDTHGWTSWRARTDDLLVALFPLE